MKNKLVLAISLICFALVGCGKQNNTIVIGTNAYFEPYEFYDNNNELSGIDIEISKELFTRLGLDYTIEDMEFDNILPSIKNGKIDCAISAITITDERKKEFNFTIPYSSSVQSVVIKDQNITAIEDLDNYIIGVQKGTTGADLAKEDFSKVEEFSKTSDLQDALKNNKIQAIIIDEGPATNLVADNEGFYLLNTNYVDEEYGIVVKDKDLLNKINNTLQEMIDDGTIEKIIGNY